ncbi:mCG1038150 [Mus musculus]|nr:mCG1038150 [Mus musculus]
MSTGLEKRNIFYIYIYMHITLLMRRRLTKNRIYTTSRRANGKGGSKEAPDGWRGLLWYARKLAPWIFFNCKKQIFTVPRYYTGGVVLGRM